MDNAKKVVGVIFGGPSGEHEVSCVSAQSIVDHLDRNLFEVMAIGVARDGRWFGPIPHDRVSQFKAEDFEDKEIYLVPKPDQGRVYSLATNEVIGKLDVVFEIIHGTYGEDGRLQGLLDICKIPYVGPGVTGSAVGMDKVVCRRILAGEGIEQVNYTVVNRSHWEKFPEQVLDLIESELKYPIFVKPANMGSSVGISRATDRNSLSEAICLAARFDHKLMVEEGIEMREIEMAVMGNEDIHVSLPGEILSATTFYDYEAKYKNTESKTQVPADLPEEIISQLQSIAKKVYVALDLSGLSRIDFFVEKGTNRVLLNEVNTLPGFTPISMYSQMWQASGIDMSMLLEQLIYLAFERNKEINRNEIQM